MFCQQCGCQLADGAKFCPRCGAPVEAAVPQSAAPIAQGSDSASNTVATANTPSPSPGDSPKDRRKGNYYATIGIIYGLVSVVLFLIVYVWNGVAVSMFTAVGQGWAIAAIAYLLLAPILSICSIYYSVHSRKFNAGAGGFVIGLVLGIIGIILWVMALIPLLAYLGFAIGGMNFVNSFFSSFGY